MCELEKQMNAMLAGNKPTVVTKAITILSMDLDKKFSSIDEKLDIILETVRENKLDTDKKLVEIQNKNNVNCESHKKEIDRKLKKVEFITVFQDNPWILKSIGIALLVVTLMMLGYSLPDIYNKLIALK